MFENITHIHMVGIGGIGMSAIAKLLVVKGKTVTGSDIHESDITKDLQVRGTPVVIGHSTENVPMNTDLLIFSAAVPDTNLERLVAKNRQIPEKTYAQALGDISREHYTIAIAGTHGKSTTTALLGLILEAAGYDPTVIVGSLVPSFKDGNLRVGEGKYFVVEACEYEANMMSLDPKMIVLTSVEPDHLDYYHDFAHVKKAFQEFLLKLGKEGFVIYNADNPATLELNIAKGIGCSFDGDSVYTAKNRNLNKSLQTVEIYKNGSLLGEITLQIPGLFNVYNVLQATSAALELGVSFEICTKVIRQFGGLWRRFERVGQWHDAEVISDYGHHPTAIRETLKAAREVFPDRRIVLCFQPHQHSRTQELFKGFVEELVKADLLVLVEIYDVAGRDEDKSISSNDIIKAMSEQDAKKAEYVVTLDEAEKALNKLIKQDDVLIIMGAGDVDLIARRLARLGD